MKRRSVVRRGRTTLELVRSKTEICLLAEFRINGIEASVWEFGRTRDDAPASAPGFGCGDRVFVPHTCIQPEVLEKYGLQKEDLEDVLYILEKELHTGYCARCR